jgi:hypothetical protein
MENFRVFPYGKNGFAPAASRIYVKSRYSQALLFAELESPGDSSAASHVFRIDLTSIRSADEE